MLHRIAFAFFVCMFRKQSLFVKMSKSSKNCAAFVNICSQIQIQELCVELGPKFSHNL